VSAAIDEPHIGLIVEGRGDRGSVPVLLRKYLHAQEEFREILGSPVNVKGIGNATRVGGIEGFTAAVGNRPGCVGVLVVLDGEGEPVCELGPELLRRIEGTCRAPVRVALADASFEDWIYASAETLELEGLTWEQGRNGGTQLSKAIRPKAYTKPVEQPKLTHRVDIETARKRSPSLERMLNRFDELRELLP